MSILSFNFTAPYGENEMLEAVSNRVAVQDPLLGMPVPANRKAEAVRVFLIGVDDDGTIVMLSRETDLDQPGANYKDKMNDLIRLLSVDYENRNYQPAPPPVKKPTRVVFYIYIDKWTHDSSPIEVKGLNDTFYDYEQENEAVEVAGKPFKAFSIHNAFMNVPLGIVKRYEFNLKFYVKVTKPPVQGSGATAMRTQYKEMILDPDMENDGTGGGG